MQSSVGNIVRLRHVIFKTQGKEIRHDIDHSFFTGRPAIVICETDDTLYHLLITHKCWRGKDEIKDYPVPDELDVAGFVKLNEIHTRPLCYEKEYGTVSNEYLLKILLLLCAYQENNIQDEEYIKIKPLIMEKIYELSSNMEKTKEKIKK